MAQLKGVMTYTQHPLVSSDLNHDPHSSTILVDQTKVIAGNFVNIMGWYDNEWGFSNRMADVTAAFAKTLDMAPSSTSLAAGGRGRGSSYAM